MLGTEFGRRVGEPPARSEPLIPAAPPDPKLELAKKKLMIGTSLCFTFMLIEIGGGIWAGSLAIIADAAHMLSDVAGFLVSVFALVLSTRTATSQYSFGYARAEILGAIFSIFVVWFMTALLLYEAVAHL